MKKLLIHGFVLKKNCIFAKTKKNQDENMENPCAFAHDDDNKRVPRRR